LVKKDHHGGTENTEKKYLLNNWWVS